MAPPVLQGGQRRRARWSRRRRRRWWPAGAVVLLTVVAVIVFAFTSNGGSGGPSTGVVKPDHKASIGSFNAPSAVAHVPHRVLRPLYGRRPAPAAERVRLKLKQYPRSAILFDVNTGRVLWAHNPQLEVPIASLTKMMTSVIVNDRTSPGGQAKITKEVLGFSGSGVGVLPKNKWVRVETLLYGLLLPSGNDAAIALALKVSHTQKRFVALMNRRASQMGLGCSHFASPSGIVDARNFSCTSDLAVLTRAMLRRPRLARIIRTRQISLPLPIKGGHVYLYNNNPLLLRRYPGTEGVKTGFTDAAGACLVSVVRRGRARLGVVMLHSVDPAGQSEKLYDAGFEALRRSGGA